MERINENLVTVFEQRKMSFEQLAEIDADVDAAKDAYEKVLNELWQVRAEAREKYIQDVFIMRRNMTRVEWDAAFGDAED
jgi:1-deoxy-D-xylulose 5-phosphate reductoisomerase